MNTIVPIRRTTAALAAVLLFAGLTFAPAFTIGAHAATTHAATHKKNWVQRHPTLTAVGAGVVTHHELKVAAKNAKLHGKKLNWAERHPTLTAIGVGAVTRHEIKKHTPK